MSAYEGSKMQDVYKRFMVFAWDDYYPSGGLSEVRGSFDTIQEALDFISNLTRDNATIFDRIEGVEIG